MFLKDLIEWLEKQPPNTKVPVGFGDPYSFRGYYADLAFVPMENTTVGQMLAAAKSAVGAVYFGWKEGVFRMHDYTRCWLAEEGCDGEVIGPVLLNYMVGAYERDKCRKCKHMWQYEPLTASSTPEDAPSDQSGA